MATTAKKTASDYKLVIVESPAKATTIKNYLGSGYRVVASKGHVRDLPKSSLAVDVDHDFQARYINIRGKGDLIAELKKSAKGASKIFLATDPDREGEAISWHLAAALGIPVEESRRVTFNEITKTAVKAAIKSPRSIDMDLVNSQQARRIVDRIVGYKLSPFLWKNVRSGLSAGRVQSVATRMIVEREQEINAFVPKEYWTVEANLQKQKQKLSAKFHGYLGKGKTELTSSSEAQAVVDCALANPFTVASVKRSIRQKHPAPPFTTSTLQQEASKKLGFQASLIMRLAQELYEGINLGAEFGGLHGLITYMRTDSLRVSEEAQSATKELIAQRYGSEYCPKSPRVYRSKGNIQDAHEAIRPSDVNLDPEKIKKHLSASQYKLYKLIWSRFVASQMASAELDTVQAELQSGNCIFHTSGYTVKFPGHLAVYEESEDATEDSPKKAKLPDLQNGEVLQTNEVIPSQHFTEPAPRYTEASLIKFLEEKGIGRPSTYAPIITTILERGYVVREGKSLKPTQLGEITTSLMLTHFPEITDYAFTAQLEEDLDEIENGQLPMERVLHSFYDRFADSLAKAEETVEKQTVAVPPEETDIICEKCGARMVVKSGKFGKFAACPNYPTCKNTKPLKPKKEEAPKEEQKEDENLQKCELCGGNMVLRSGRYGSFYACSNYPNCKNTKAIARAIGVSCPACGGQIVAKRGKNKTLFYSCENYPECDFSSWDLPLQEKCPNCGKILFRKKGKNLIVCHDCDFRKTSEQDANEEA